MLEAGEGAQLGEEVCGLGVGGFHHAEPLFEAGGGIGRIAGVFAAELEEAAYPHEVVGKTGGLGREALVVALDLAGEVGGDDGAAPEHNVLAAAGLADGEVVGQAEYVAIGDDRDAECLADGGDLLPMGRRAVAFDFGAGVHGQRGGAALGDGLGAFEGAGAVFIAEAHFGGEGDVFR